MDVFVRNAAGTRAVKLTTQYQLDIIRDVINEDVASSRFEAVCRRRLEEAGVAPDFDGPDAVWSFTKPAQALAVLDRIEYSSDGFVKRYPDEGEYHAAVAFLKAKHKVKK